MNTQVAGAQFVSKTSSAGIVNVELGFIPDFVMLFAGYDQANPNIYFWAKGGTGKTFPQYTAALSLLVTGTTGVVTRDVSGIDEYAGGETIAAAETDNTAGKHVNRAGVAAGAGHVTAPGITVPVDHQTASAFNLVLAWRVNAQP